MNLLSFICVFTVLLVIIATCITAVEMLSLSGSMEKRGYE